MTLVKGKPSGFNPGQRLLASELNTMQDEYVKAIDGYGGGTYSLSSALNIDGNVTLDILRTTSDDGYFGYIDISNTATINKVVVEDNIYLPGYSSWTYNRVDKGNIDLSGQIRYSEEIVSANMFGARIGTSAVNWVAGEEPSSGGANTLYYETNTTSSSATGRLWIDIPHPQRSDYYLRGYTVYSQHVGTAHSAVPGTPFSGEIYQIRPGGSYFYRSDVCASTVSAALYDAAQQYVVTIPTSLRPAFESGYKYILGLNNESGSDAAVGRRVRAVFFHFTRDA